MFKKLLGTIADGFQVGIGSVVSYLRNNRLDLPELSADPDAPGSGRGYLYHKSGKWYVRTPSSIVEISHLHANKANLDLINQGLGTTDRPTFNGVIVPTGQNFKSGDEGQFQFFYNGTNCYLQLLSGGDLVVWDASNSKVLGRFVPGESDGHFEAHYNGSKVMETTANGLNLVAGKKFTVGGVDVADILSGRILQIVSDELEVEDAYTTTSSDYQDTPLSLAITPSKTSGKIILCCMVTGYQETTTLQTYKFSQSRIVRGASTQVGQALTLGLTSTGANIPVGKNYKEISFLLVDSPNTTSSVTYTLQVKSGNSNITTGVSCGNFYALEIG